MSALVELRDRIQSTNALIMQYESSIAEIKGDATPPSLLANVRSLEKLKRRLEAEFLEEASELELEVYRYRILNDSRITLAAISEAWGKFDDFFGSVYSALKKPPKTEGKKPPQSEPLELGYGYSYAGSVGVVVTVPKDIGIYAASPIEDASGMVFDMIEARNLGSIAKIVGPEPVRKLHSWIDVHIRNQAGLGLEWRSRQELKRSVMVEYQSLAKIQTTISETATIVGIDVIGELQGAYIEPKKFKIKGDNGQDYEGTFENAITQEHAASVPARYNARIIQTTKIIIIGKEPETTFFLESLKPLT
jgi:hypothetical protein